MDSTETTFAFVKLRFRSFLFIFFTRFGIIRLLFMHCSLNNNHKCWLSTMNSVYVHYLRTHKLHFSATFSLKMGPTILFTHLKITLLQYFQFSVFSFSKISSIQTDPKCICVWNSFLKTWTPVFSPHTPQTLILIEWSPHQGYAIVFIRLI